MKIRVIVNYIKKFFEEDNGKPSIKRVMGTFMLISSVLIGKYGVAHQIEHLDAVIGLVAVLEGAGLTCLGLSTWGGIKTKQIESGQASNNAVNIDNVENVSVDTKIK